VACSCVSLFGATRLIAAEFSCPATITVNEALIQVPPPGWTSESSGTPRHFSGVTFFDGDPRENQSIAPTRDTAWKAHQRLAVWQLGSSGGVWLGCRYADSATLLVRELPAGIHECQVVCAAGGVVKSIDCR
jgi:hypothetical protein